MNASAVSENERFTRTKLLLGEDAFSRLRHAKVFVAGLGGVGSSCAEALIRAGIGSFVFVDNDTVEASNINRQVIAFDATIGKDKVSVMSSMARSINPAVNTEAHKLFLRGSNVDVLLETTRPDFVVDCIDTVSTKIELAWCCSKRSIPFLSAMGAGNKTDPTQFEFADIFDTSSCRLCRAVRKGLRKRGVEHVRVLYSKEKAHCVPQQRIPLEDPCTPHVAAAEADAVSSEGLPPIGTISYMPSIMGMMLAGDAIRQIACLDCKDS